MLRSCSRNLSRRNFLASVIAAPAILKAADSSPRVAIARCAAYNNLVYDSLQTMFDRLGGLSRLVNGKTVTIKVNLTGSPETRLNNTPVGNAQWVHWGVIGCTLALLGEAGARRIQLCESAGDTSTPLEAYFVRAGWDPSYFVNAAPNVQLVNTNIAARYSRLNVPFGGFLFPGFDLAPAYSDCDVFVSLTKLKQHVMAGVTLSMKNIFGMLPLTIYGTNAGVDEPGTRTTGFRGEVMHAGLRKPSLSAPQERYPGIFRDAGGRLPRVITDLCGARPIHLAIIDGIETMTGAEGPWTKGIGLANPGVLIAGLNPVATDAVAMAVMGLDPMSPAGSSTFRGADNMLAFGELAGLGTRRLADIEVVGEKIESVVYPFPPLGDATAM